MVQRNKASAFLSALLAGGCRSRPLAHRRSPCPRWIGWRSESSRRHDGGPRAGRVAARYAVRSARCLSQSGNSNTWLEPCARARLGGNSGDARSATLTQRYRPALGAQGAYRSSRSRSAGQRSDGLRAFEADTCWPTFACATYEVLRRKAELRNAREDADWLDGKRPPRRIALRVETGEAPRFELIKADAEMINAQKSVQAAGFRAEQAAWLWRRHERGYRLQADYSTCAAPCARYPSCSRIETVRQALPDSSPTPGPGTSRGRRGPNSQFELERRRKRWPSLAVKGGYDEDPDMRTSRLGVVVTVPLRDRRSGPVGEASAQPGAGPAMSWRPREFSLDQQLAVAYQQYEIALGPGYGPGVGHRPPGRKRLEVLPRRPTALANADFWKYSMRNGFSGPRAPS